MNAPLHAPGETDPAAQSAAEWVLRHDRGLTASEQDEFSLWLAAEPRHRAAWAEQRWGWDELDRLAGLQASVHAVPDPDLLAPRRPVARTPWLWPVLAAAAVVALGVFLAPKPAPVATHAVAPGRSLALIEQRELPDGSVIELNRGAVVTEHFTAGERRVRLARGEAHFTVVKDPARPFFVEAGGVAVRAVGTAFNVKLDPASVEVLVTEGRVQVAAVVPHRPARTPERGGQRPGSGAPDGPHLNPNERVVVSLAASAPPPQVTSVPPAEMEARLAWQPRLLDFDETPLPEILAEFNRRNPVRLRLADPALRAVRLSATFRSDNVDAFVRFMEADFGMKVSWRDDDEIVLAQAR